MKPLSWIAVGYLLTALYALVHGYDLLADPVGWLLVLVGVRRLPDTVSTAGLRGTAWCALVVAVPLWVPAVSDALDDADPSLAWALSLPALGFVALLCHHLGTAARELGERRPGRVFSMLLGLTAVVAVMPVLVFGGHQAELDDVATSLSQLLAIALFVVLLTYAGRRWSDAVIDESVTREPSSS